MNDSEKLQKLLDLLETLHLTPQVKKEIEKIIEKKLK